MIGFDPDAPWRLDLLVDPLAEDPVAIIMGPSPGQRREVLARLASLVDAEFIDADALHPPESLAKVLNGEALFGDERRLWLDEIAARLRRPRTGACIVSCSPLRYMHRSLLRRSAPHAQFFRLDDAPGERTGMPQIGSEQFFTTDDFRPQEDGIIVARSTPGRAAAEIVRHLSDAPVEETVA
jgi:gluconate kinase